MDNVWKLGRRVRSRAARVGKWTVTARGGVAGVVSRLVAVVMAISGLTLTALAIPGGTAYAWSNGLQPSLTVGTAAASTCNATGNNVWAVPLTVTVKNIESIAPTITGVTYTTSPGQVVLANDGGLRAGTAIAAGTTQTYPGVLLDVTLPAGTSSATVNIDIKANWAPDDSSTYDYTLSTPVSFNTNCTAAPKVSVAKTGPATGSAGGSGTYTLVATNSGNADATGVTITDTLPTGETFVSSSPTGCTASGQTVSCPVGTLTAGGGSATIGVTVSYGSDTAGMALTDCATVPGQTNASCATTNIPGQPDVSVAKTGPASGLPGGEGTYQLLATNSGTADATGVTITDTLPTGETFVSSDPTGCTAAGQTVTCTVPPLAAKGGSATVNVVVSYGSNTAGQVLKDCATVAGQETASCASTNILSPKLAVVKSGPATGTAGGTGTYDLVATNTGGAPASDVTVTDTLPAGETFVSSNPAGCTASGQTVTCPVGTLAATTGTATVHVTVSYGAGTAGQSMTDCATVAGQSTPSCVTTTIQQQTLTGEIYLCQNGQQTTTAIPGTISAAGPQTVGAVSSPLSVVQVLAGDYTMTASLPSDSTYKFTQCGGSSNVGSPPSTATEGVNVPAGGTGNGVFYVAPITQNLVGDIYLCVNGTTTTTEEAGGSISATGPQTVGSTPNPLSQSVGAGTYTVDSTAPSGYEFVECGVTGVNVGTPASTAEAPGVVVPAGGTGVAIFYVQHTVAAAGSITLTVAKSNDANGSGTYAQTESASGPNQDVPFRVVVTNPSTVPVTITGISDSWPGQAAFSPSCASALDGTTLAPGHDVTCDFTLDNYSPAAGDSLTNTVKVTGCKAVEATNCVTVAATSTVNTPAAAATPAKATTPTASSGALAFTGSPTRLRLLLELGTGMLSLGLFILWFTRPRRIESKG